MREITKEMIKLYNIKKLGYDFMGYTFKNVNELMSFKAVFSRTKIIFHAFTLFLR